MKYPQVHLHSGRDQSLERRHQWIFSKAIKTKDDSIRDGDIVSICDVHGNIRATAHYQDSSLALRILEFGDASIDSTFWNRKLRTACNYRQELGLISNPLTNAYRLVHGEGDEMPGLIVDVYSRVAVIQAHSIGMFRQRNDIAQALMTLERCGIERIYDKSANVLPQEKTSSDPSLRQAWLPVGKAPGKLSSGQAHTTQQSEKVSGTSNSWLAGEGDDATEIAEDGIRFIVDVVNGQKTGFFLDQRINRTLVKEFAAGKDVLNCFSYTGGFSLYALVGNAKHVTSVDSSSPALELLEMNLGLNTFPGTHHAAAADVIYYLSNRSETYDLVICDPPAFAKSIQKRHAAVQAYKRLNVLALKKVRPGGMLFTFSCSQVVDRQLFYDTVVAAAIEAGRPVRVMFEMRQGPDHPVSVFHPEGSYLKGVALYIS